MVVGPASHAGSVSFFESRRIRSHSLWGHEFPLDRPPIRRRPKVALATTKIRLQGTTVRPTASSHETRDLRDGFGLSTRGSLAGLYGQELATNRREYKLVAFVRHLGRNTIFLP
jgi:hypothetical protein